jgi:hypothetical protein
VTILQHQVGFTKSVRVQGGVKTGHPIFPNLPI